MCNVVMHEHDLWQPGFVKLRSSSTLPPPHMPPPRRRRRRVQCSAAQARAVCLWFFWHTQYMA